MSKSSFSKKTIMVARPRPDRNVLEERRALKARIKKDGLRKVVDEIVEEYYQWEEDPDPVSARKKKRTILIFSKSELNYLVPNEIFNLLGGFAFLESNN